MRSSRLVRVAATLIFALAAVAAVAGPGAAPQSAEPINAPDHPLLQGFRWRSIGPVGQGGRVDDIAVNPQNPKNFFIGFATGGLWKTTNNGTSVRLAVATISLVD